MANILYANNAAGTLLAGLTSGSTSLTLGAGQGAAFPSPVAPQVFYVTLTDAATQTLIEIVKVTAVAGDVFSIVRAQDGTSALSWNAGDIVSQRVIRLELQGFENAAEGNFKAQVVPITPSTTLGIVGTATADNANAGAVGEFVSNTQLAGSLATGVPASVTSVLLSAGDWDVSAVVAFLPAGSTTIGSQAVGISLVVNTFGGFGSQANIQGFTAVGAGCAIPSPIVRVNVAVPTTVYITAEAIFSGGTCGVQGFISARRVR
jgi:hypothetical protein